MLYTVKELSEKLHKNPETIRRWCRNGKVKATRNSKKEGYMIEYNFDKEDTNVDITQERIISHDNLRKACMRFIKELDEEQIDKIAKRLIELMKE